MDCDNKNVHVWYRFSKGRFIVGAGMSTCLLFIPFCSMIVLWMNTPKYYDFFKIRNEMKIVFFCGIAKYVAYVVFLTIKLMNYYR